MKSIKTFLPIAVASVLIVGCSSNAPTKSTLVEHCEFRAGEQAPEWYCTPDLEGGIAAVGEAKMNSANDGSFQRSEALANARDELARQLDVKVSNMFKSFAAITGDGGSDSFDKVAENVSRQLTQQTLTGSKQLKHWASKDGTLVLLVGMTDNNQIVDNIKSSLKNEKALWQKLQAKKSQEEMDAYLEKEFGL